MKQCIRCKRELPISEFNKDCSKKDGLSSYCRECFKKRRDETRDERNVVRRENYKLNRNHIREQNKRYIEEHYDDVRRKQREHYHVNRERILAQRKAFKDEIYKLKTPCMKCGEDRLYLIQFHHSDYREKRFEISRCGGRTLDSVLDEIKKCVCLCSNCHDEYHYFYGDKPDDPIETLEEYLGKRIIELLGGESK